MISFNRLALTILLPVLGIFLRAQPGLLEREINITPGTYSGIQLIEVISQNGITISYSHSALTLQDVTLTAGSIKIRELLEKLFEPGQYKYVIRRNKILVVPRKGNATPGHSGGYFKREEWSFPIAYLTYTV